MSRPSSILKYATMAVAASAVVITVYVHERDQRARQDKVELELAAERDDLTEARASLAARAPEAAPLVVTTRDDTALSEAVAARVVAATEARTKSAAIVAAEAQEPTGEQLAARAQAKSVAENAIARGHLRTEDVREIRQLVRGDAAGFGEAFQTILGALNQGKLSQEDAKVLMGR